MKYYLLAINILAFLLFAVDKAMAMQGWRRVPEKHLLALTVAGGGVGALVAMFLFRHKTRKALFIFLPLAAIALYAFLFIRFFL